MRRASHTARAQAAVPLRVHSPLVSRPHPARSPPAGYVEGGDKYAGHETLKLLVRSEMVSARGARAFCEGGDGSCGWLHSAREEQRSCGSH